jgi:hypothetical protein
MIDWPPALAKVWTFLNTSITRFTGTTIAVVETMWSMTARAMRFPANCDEMALIPALDRMTLERQSKWHGLTGFECSDNHIAT